MGGALTNLLFWQTLHQVFPDSVSTMGPKPGTDSQLSENCSVWKKKGPWEHGCSRKMRTQVERLVDKSSVKTLGPKGGTGISSEHLRWGPLWWVHRSPSLFSLPPSCHLLQQRFPLLLLAEQTLLIPFIRVCGQYLWVWRTTWASKSLFRSTLCLVMWLHQRCSGSHKEFAVRVCACTLTRSPSPRSICSPVCLCNRGSVKQPCKLAAWSWCPHFYPNKLR